MKVPRWVSALVRLIAPPGRAEDAIGDLMEMHARRVTRHRRYPVAGCFCAVKSISIALRIPIKAFTFTETE